MRTRSLLVLLLAALAVASGCSSPDPVPDRTPQFSPGTFKLTWMSTRDTTGINIAHNTVTVMRNGFEIGRTETSSSLVTPRRENSPVHAVWLVGDGPSPRRVATFNLTMLVDRGVRTVDLDPWNDEREVMVTTELSSDVTKPSPDPFLSVTLE